MRTTGYTLVALFVVLFAPTLSAQVNDTYVIAASAYTAGANNTVWATDLDLFNPHSYTLNIRLIFLPTGGDKGEMVRIDVFPNENFSIDNVVQKAFERSGTGAILAATFPEDNPGVTDSVFARSFLVATRTFNNASSGTYGQNIPGVWAGLQNFAADNISGIVHGVVESGSNTTGFRSNIGAVNLGRYSVKLRVSVYDGNGSTLLDRAPFDVPPQGHIQDRLPVSVFYGTVEFFVEDPTGDGLVFPYVSIVDNRSGDAIFRGATLYAPASAIFTASAAKDGIGTRLSTSVAREVAKNAVDLGTFARLERSK